MDIATLREMLLSIRLDFVLQYLLHIYKYEFFNQCYFTCAFILSFIQRKDMCVSIFHSYCSTNYLCPGSLAKHQHSIECFFLKNSI